MKELDIVYFQHILFLPHTSLPLSVVSYIVTN